MKTESLESRPYQRYPDFNLKSVHNKHISSQKLIGKNGLIVLFTCNHCPYAKALWGRLIEDIKTIASAGFSVAAINPNNHSSYPEDSFEEMQVLSNSLALPFPYLFDETQDTAKRYDAQCTPDLFVLSSQMELLYRGAYDNNWKHPDQVTERFLIQVITSKEWVKATVPSIGCSIKWQKI
jgi:peroxiredoxin